MQSDTDERSSNTARGDGPSQNDSSGSSSMSSRGGTSRSELVEEEENCMIGAPGGKKKKLLRRSVRNRIRGSKGEKEGSSVPGTSRDNNSTPMIRKQNFHSYQGKVPQDEI